MATVPIDIFFVGKTAVDRGEMERWLKRVGVSDQYQLPPPETVTDSALLIGTGGKRCYKSFEVGMNPNVAKIRADWGEYIDNILKSGHGSVLEHAVYNFAFEGVSRVFTGEMNRHRAGWAISEGSMRFIRFEEEVPYWEPDSIKGPDVLDRAEKIPLGEMDYEGLLYALRGEYGHRKLELPTLDAKQEATRILLARTFQDQSDWYKCLVEIWKEELDEKSAFAGKKALTSLFRRGIGMGCATGGMWSGNIRGLRHVITMRAAAGAEEEILHVFSRVAKRIVEEEPMLFGDFVEENGLWRPKYVKV
jgi:thymidylate synthase (FAD)